MYQPLNHHVETTAKIINTSYIKTPRAKNSAQLITLVIEKDISLHHGVVETPRFISHSAGFWANLL